MKKSFGEYRLIAKRSRGGGSLWLGPDHLLEIENSGFIFTFSENYRRIDYRNIQAITCARTSTWIWLSVVSGLAALGFLGVAALVIKFGTSTESWVVTSILAVGALLSLITLAVNLVKGPSCVCKLQTAVQIRHLKPISRLRAAERFVWEITPLCVAHQGGEAVTPEEIRSIASVPQSGQMPIRDGVPLPPVHLKLPWIGAKVVTAAMVLLIVSGLVTIATLFVNNLVLFTLNWILAASAYITTISALVKTTRFELPAPLKSSFWGTVVVCVLSAMTAFGLFVWAGVASKHRFYGERDSMVAYNFLAHVGMKELDWAAWLIMGLGAAAIFLGLLGLPAALWPIGRTSASAPGAPISPPPQPMAQPVSPEFKP